MLSFLLFVICPSILLSASLQDSHPISNVSFAVQYTRVTNDDRLELDRNLASVLANDPNTAQVRGVLSASDEGTKIQVKKDFGCKSCVVIHILANEKEPSELVLAEESAAHRTFDDFYAYLSYHNAEQYLPETVLATIRPKKELLQNPPICIVHNNTQDTLSTLKRIKDNWPLSIDAHPWAFQYRTLSEISLGFCWHIFKSYQ